MDKTLQIDDELVRAAQELTGEVDERAAVESMLRKSVAARRKNRDLLDLVGKVEFHEGYDPKALRFSRHDPD
ncbi:MAG: hypothetical protein ACT4N2_03955 [Hyphomicrobium sp.]